MLADKLNALKEAVNSAQKVASEIAATMPSPNSNKFLRFLSKALDTILLSINESSLETKLILLCLTEIRVCSAIFALANARDLAQIRGVSVESTLKSAKKAAAAAKTAKTFAMVSLDEEEPIKLDFIMKASRSTNSCVLALSEFLKTRENKETIIELSNVLITICSLIAYLASNIALNYACGDASVCDEHSNADK